MKRRVKTVLLYLLFAGGILAMLYPFVSDWWNQKHATQMIVDYEEVTSSLSEEDIARQLEEAKIYNEQLAVLQYPLVQYEQVSGYEDILNVDVNGVMGFIEIPKIDVSLPIYHGTSNHTLSTAAGHLQGTSLPVGGIGSHAVIMAHRGLPSAVLFTNLDKLDIGDVFILYVLGQELTYEVDQIVEIDPSDTKYVNIDPDMDYVTLLTCTPYGVNTERLLVRGHRILNLDDGQIDAIEKVIDWKTIGCLFGAAILVLWLIRIILRRKRNRKTAAQKGGSK